MFSLQTTTWWAKKIKLTISSITVQTKKLQITGPKKESNIQSVGTSQHQEQTCFTTPVHHTILLSGLLLLLHPFNGLFSRTT